MIRLFEAFRSPATPRNDSTFVELPGRAYIGHMSRPLAVANEFIRQYGQANDLTHLKLQKLTYFAQGWWLAIKGEDLIEERPQVWRYGPVFESLFRTLSGAGDQPIKQLAGTSPFGDVKAPTLEAPVFESQREMISWIWSEYGKLSGPQLSDLTHDVGTPWRKIAEERNFRVPLNFEIPREEDWGFFAKLATERGFTPKPLS